MSTHVTGSTGGGEQIPSRLTHVGPGWHPLLRRLHERLLALAADYRLEEFTPKLGGLRIYVADRFDDDGEFDGAWADMPALSSKQPRPKPREHARPAPVGAAPASTAINTAPGSAPCATAAT